MNKKPRLLDLFCGAGGATKGYQRAGFYVIGIDNRPQNNYCGDEFHQADALAYPLDGFDVIHASPPCQIHSCLSHLAGSQHLDLIPKTREKLKASGLPYVIENVVGAELVSPVMLCGTMFGLKTGDGVQLIRHRLFEINPQILLLTPGCSHSGRTISIFGDKARDTAAEKRYYLQPKKDRGPTPRDILFTLKDSSAAMGIDWMNQKEMSQAIPPAYTEYIGNQLMRLYFQRMVNRKGE